MVKANYKVLMCEHLVIKTSMLFPQRIILGQVCRMWLITIITFELTDIVFYEENNIFLIKKQYYTYKFDIPVYNIVSNKFGLTFVMF